MITPLMTSLRKRTNPRQDGLIADAYRSLQGAVEGYVRRRIGWEREEDAEDLVQDTFLQLLEYDVPLEQEKLASLVYTIARNGVIDYLRHHVRTLAAQEYFRTHTRAQACTTEQQVAVNELERMEMDCLKRMPEQKARVFILYLHEGKSVTEISDALRLSPRTVENHIYRARVDLRRTFKLAC